ncbi:MAG: DUF5678 domain-containing protein [Blastocatellia bacterium]
MSVITAENILAQVNQLPPMERQNLIALLNNEPCGNEPFYYQPEEPAEEPRMRAEVKIPPARIISVSTEFNDRAREYEWLKQHRREYVGQWVALDGDQLVAYGVNAKEVFAKADSLGIELPLVLLVEDPDVHYAGF